MSRTRIHPEDAPDLQTDTEAGTHAADSTAVHGITDTADLSTTAHDHDADYEAIGATATHSADTTAVHGIADTSALSLTSHDHDADYEAAGTVATHEADTTAIHGIADTSVLSLTSHDHDADYDVLGAAAAAAAASQPVDSDLTAIAALTTTAFGRGLLELADAAALAAAHSHGGSNPWTTIIKLADTARVNNTVAADPDLVVTLLANTGYTLFFRVFMTTNATADSRYQLTFSGTTTRVRRQIMRTATSDVPALIITGTAFDASPVVLSTTGVSPYVEERIVLQVGASGGTFAFQWAQVTTNGSPCTVLEGSYLEYAVT